MTSSSELVQIFSTVDFQELIRKRIFGTEPEMYNYAGTEVQYWLMFSTIVAEFGSDTDWIVVSGSSQDYLKGTLPQKIQYEPIDFLFDNTLAMVIAADKEPDTPFLKLKPGEIKTYLNSTYLLTRVDSESESNQEVIFVSNGSMTTMFPDVFKREMEAVVQGTDFDPEAGTSAKSGWYIGLTDGINLQTETYQDQELITNTSENLIGSTVADMIVTNTLPPLINWSTDPEKIYTFSDGTTAPSTIIMDFGSYPTLQYKADEADGFLFWLESGEDTIVCGVGETPMMPNPEKTTCNLTAIEIELTWDKLIII